MTTEMLNSFSRLCAAAILLTAALGGATAAAQGGLRDGSIGGCGAVIVAEFEWPAAQVTAHVLERALREGYGCLATLEPADPSAALRAIQSASGPEDIGARLILPGVAAPEEAEGGVAVGGAVYAERERSGLFISSWLLAETPHLRRLADLPALGAALAASRRRPRLYLCPASWPCAAEAAELSARLRLSRWFAVETPADGAALLASLEAAERDAATRTPWIGYMWAPSVWADAGRLAGLANDGVEYCPPGEACREAFARPPLRMVYSAALAERTPRVEAFLNNFTLPAEALSDALIWRAANNADVKQTAAYLLGANDHLWAGWFDGRAAAAFRRLNRPSGAPEAGGPL